MAFLLGALSSYAYIKNAPSEILAGKPKMERLPEGTSPSAYNTGITYEQAMKSNKPMMVLFYADWCGYCKRFAGLLPDIVNEFSNDMNILLVNCEDPANKHIFKNYYVKGYPTVYIVDPKYDFKHEVLTTFPLELVQKELRAYINLRK